MDYRNDEVENSRGRSQQRAAGHQPMQRYSQDGQTYGEQPGGQGYTGQPGGYQPGGQGYGSQPGGRQPGGQTYAGQAGGRHTYENQTYARQAGGHQAGGQRYGSQPGGHQPGGPSHSGQQPGGRRVAGGQYGSQQSIAKARAVSKRREELENLRRDRDRKKRLKRRIIVMIVAECFTLAAIFGYAYFARRISLMPRPDVDKKNVINDDLQVEDLEKMKGYWMIAVFM